MPEWRSLVANLARLMRAYHEEFPQYDFAKHKGYGTPYHLAKLREHGPCAIHRMTFEPCMQATNGPKGQGT